MICSSALIISLFLWSNSALHSRYVKPDNLSSQSCPDQPCLTLDQYTQQAARYFTTGSTFLFLPGNHTLHTTINLTGIYELKFKRSEEKGSTIYGNYSKILCMRVINFTIDGLTLKTTHFKVSESTGIVISNSTFLGNGTLTENSTSALTCCNSNITVINSHFKGNTGYYGGAININVTNLFLINSTFIRNMAHYGGGAIFALSSKITVRVNLIYDFNNSGTAVNIFSCNLASEGGAIYLVRTNVVFGGVPLKFQGSSVNVGMDIKSALNFQNSRSTSLFSGNLAHQSGGAIYTNYGAIKLLLRNVTFVNNSANLSGGAMYASSTDIEFHNNILFSNNSANTGGGMYFVDVSLTIKSGMTLNTSLNNASTYGGAIYYEDTLCRGYFTHYYVDKLPLCFIQLIGTELTGNTSMAIHSYYNTAGEDGSFMFGGSLDRCELKSTNVDGKIDYNIITSSLLDNVILQTNNSINDISSYPYQLCYCGNDQFCPCFMNISICRGQKFRVSLFAIAQAGSHVLTTVTARTSDNARLESNQTYQKLTQQYNCSSLVYNLYSTEDHEELTFHPDGPCSREYISLHVTFLPCPPGFTQSNDECVCEQRLMKFATTCTINEDSIISILQNSGSKFWINASYIMNGTYHGLIICETCPVEYCKTDTIAISLNNSDMQCALNRSGVLCGACVTNYSLMLGSSRCHVCPTTYLALLLLFAAAGIALVVFLSILRLTVATGMINSVILYANIVQVNRHLFFPINTVNVLTVFIAWMNLDLGIETCFYNGMTAYAQTWLQFAFPIYIWILITLIIITSRYSVTVSKLIGHNPIAVLATLLLMSYTKILKIIIEVYSSAQLEYPDNKTVTVWLKDGNIPYARSLHFLLIVVTSLILVFLFLPYTLLLLLGYELYRFSGRKHMRWLNRLKPLLDSYYAPYNKHTRCLTGFLLLVRCALYLAFSFIDPKTSLFAIIFTFVIIVLAFGLLPGKIYTSSCANIIDSLVYSNLIILSGVILSSAANSSAALAMVYSLVGMVLVIMIGIIVYHVYILCIAHSLGLKIQAKISKVLHQVKKEDEPISENTPKEVSTTVIELREPLLET